MEVTFMFSRRSTRQTLLVLLTAALLLTACNVGATPAPTQDINALSTALVGTTVAQLSVQFTQTALAMPTNTPAPTETSTTIATFALPTLANSTPATVNPAALPTFSFVNTPVAGATQGSVLPTSPGPTTASLGDECNNSIYVADITIPDGSVLKPGEDFTKIWRIQNTGNCKWDEGYRLVFIGGDQKIDPVNFEFKLSKDFVEPGKTTDIGIPLTAPLAEGKYQGTWRMQSDGGFYFGQIVSVYFEVKKP
jgi:hypothetical protein